MRAIYVLMAGAALIASSPAWAADELKFGAPPAWVVLQVISPASDKAKDQPVALLLHDQQTLLEPGKTSSFSELAFKIQKPEGLAAGNMSIAWNPAFDTVTVNRLEIRRGDQVIDVIKSGQTFTTMRRETNLEMAMLDGMLTANIQPEGLQQGDVVVLATTTEHVDPVMKGHVEAGFAPWGSAQIGLAHARLSWPSTLALKLQKAGDLPAPQQSTRDGKTVYELTMRDVEPVIPPKGAPLRYKIGRMGEATDFRSWADAAKLMAPLYRTAAVIPASGPLREEVEKIRKASADPKVRTEQTLQLVEQRIRYVALAMGQGGYVPANAETTWSRRFGDCKAKTALLLAILHEFGIEADPVLANPFIGDAIAERLPTLGLFDHVLVRARFGGKEYWLDGTRTGDTSLALLQVPNFGWGLPLIENTQLVHIVPPPLERPDSETRIAIDATAGAYAPAQVEIEELIRGDAAVGFDRGYSQLSTEQRTELLHQNAKKYFDSISSDTSAVAFDEAKGELRISTKGTAKLEWKDGWYSVPNASIAFNPDFDRPSGPQHEAPIATDYPSFDKRTVTIDLPPKFAAEQKLLPAVHETLAGVEYARTETVSGDLLTIESSERSIVPEVLYKDALAATARLKALNKDYVYLRYPNGFRATDADLQAVSKEEPASADAYLERGLTYLGRNQFDKAVADFSAALSLDPTDVWALGNRALASASKRDFQSAERDLAELEKRDPNNQMLPRTRALAAELKGDFKAAADFYTKALEKEPNDTFCLGHRAIVLANSEPDRALSDAEQALKSMPSWTQLRILRANILMRSNRALVAGEAEAMMREAPTSDFAFVAAGKTFAALGQTEKALKAFDRALAIKPYAYIYINRAQVRPRSDFAGRMADLDAALKLEPGNADALVEKARFLANRGDYKEALAVLGGVKADPNDRYAELQRAVVLYKGGRANDARKLLESIHANSKTANELNSLCWSEATADIMLDSALEDCRQALKLSPDTGPYLDSLGMVLLKLGKLDEALEAYDKAVAKNTGADSLMGRAFVYLRKGDRVHAEADAAAARKLYADVDSSFADYGLKFDAATPAKPTTPSSAKPTIVSITPG